jgi:hypothetical protein
LLICLTLSAEALVILGNNLWVKLGCQSKTLERLEIEQIIRPVHKTQYFYCVPSANRRMDGE